MNELSYYEQKTKNIHNRLGISRPARLLLKAIDDLQSGALEESELRRMIRLSPRYRNVISQTISDIADFILNHPEESKTGAILIQLLTRILQVAEVCKAIREDFMAVFYRENKFYFNCTCEMDYFIKNNKDLQRNIVSIKVHWCGPRADKAFQALKTCPNLKQMVVVPSAATTRHLVPRQQVFNRFFAHTSRPRLTDALGMDELITLRGIHTVSVQHVPGRQGQKRTNEELANLSEILQKYVKQDKDVGYGEQIDS
ncbi:hypothetical protein OOU_Y34scaffold00071g18 [Pyricularia oryzae Y34]|uniref:Uncharacterized protein n=2 Tax=Pyricularia oryzae TaxID=318829 RepID=A0AA97PRU7_PYRO3|nr:hypothetical protein OOU_Y34scaffold00071g18 [Pyricularia oryzae Y34]